MADASINIELKGISQIRSELKALKGELANATDPTQMAELASKAGLLSDKLKDANEKVAIFAAGSPFEQTNNALGLMSSQLMSLDFEGASESAKSFAVAAKGINGEQIATQLKGLGGVVGNLGKGFMSLGSTLLTNPIFLIAGVVTAIIVAIGALLNKFGLLKPILNAVSSAFKFLMDIINGVVDSIKDFLDWLGLTSFAAEEAAQKQVDALEKVDKKREEQIAGVTKQYDLQIRLAQIEGKSTFDLERKKQLEILKTAQARYQDLLQIIENAKVAGNLSEEEMAKLIQRARDQKAVAQGARDEIKIINATETENNKKKNEEIEKADNESYKKRAESAKTYQAERLAILRQIKDLEISLIEEGVVKEIQTVDERYNRIREDLAKNEKLTSDEKKRLLELYAIEEQKARADIDAKYFPKKEAVDNSILPAPDLVEDQMDAIVDVTAEGFSNMDKLRFAFSENFQKSFDGTLGAADAMFKGMSALAEAFSGDSESSAKKAFDIQKAANIAQATMDTYKGAVGAFTQAVATYPAPLGQIIGAIQAGATVAMGVANIKKISSQKFGDKSGSVSKVGMGGGSSTSNPATPSANLFGQNNNANNLSASNSVESNQSITVKAVVSETELTVTQNKIKNIQKASAL